MFDVRIYEAIASEKYRVQAMCAPLKGLRATVFFGEDGKLHHQEYRVVGFAVVSQTLESGQEYVYTIPVVAGSAEEGMVPVCDEVLSTANSLIVYGFYQDKHVDRIMSLAGRIIGGAPENVPKGVSCAVHAISSAISTFLEVLCREGRSEENQPPMRRPKEEDQGEGEDGEPYIYAEPDDYMD